jgi:hypothetical protein
MPTAVLHAEDGIIRLGDNVNNLLHSLDSFDRIIPIWIDAICIDQSNNLEKLQQIPLMGKVYSTASKVLVYLGEPSPYVHPANVLSIQEVLPEIIEAMSEMEPGGQQSHL